ncbi:MAG: helix-turn-helix domain-containing protein [Phycisphaerae bacterium]
MADQSFRLEASHFVRGSALQLRIVQYAADTIIKPHAHAHSNLSMILNGEMTEDADDSSFSASTGDCVIKPAGTEHANRVGSAGATTLQIEMPARAWRDFSPQSPAGRYGWLPTPAASRGLFQLAQKIRNPVPRQSAMQSLATVQSALHTILVAREDSSSGSADRPDWLATVERHIAASLEAGVTVADLAARVDVHPVHLARTFRRFHGCSVVQYIHRVRIQTATRLLRDRALTLADIAARVGCCDQAHLCRLFAARIGISPSVYRTLQSN